MARIVAIMPLQLQVLFSAHAHHSRRFHVSFGIDLMSCTAGSLGSSQAARIYGASPAGFSCQKSDEDSAGMVQRFMTDCEIKNIVLYNIYFT
jgi:hypothetical protein